MNPFFILSKNGKTFRSSFFFLLFFIFSFGFTNLFGQDFNYDGIVVDENQTPMIGASIQVPNSTKGAVTDAEGRFSIQATRNDTLQVSMIGYNSQRYVLGDQQEIIVTLTLSDATALDQLVVVGFGTQKKIDVTGSVASANIDDFQNTSRTNIAQFLQGTVPGLNVGQANSAGETPDISIRGQGTISGNSSVLVVVDGIQFTGSLSSLNPNDIASVDVLKDASSTAVYGAQASNGVILITTKNGRFNEKTKVNISSSYSTSRPTVNLRPMGMEGYLNHVRDLYWDEAFLAPNYTEPNPDFDLVKRVDGSMKDEHGNLFNNNFDWWKAATRNGSTKKINASITGGSANVSYLFSLGLNEELGWIRHDDFQRKDIRLNLDSKPFDWLKVGIQSFGSFVNQDGAEPTMQELIWSSPLLVPYDEDGNLIPHPFNNLALNPFITYDVSDKDRTNYFFANIYSELDIPFIEGLKYRINFGNNYRIGNHYYASQFDAGLHGRGYKSYENYLDYTIDNILTYSKLFGDHDINVTLLYGAIRRTSDSTESSSENFDRLNLGYNSLQSGQNQFANSGGWQESLVYQMARLNYIFKSKYLLTTTVRRDGFSGFAENHRFGIFPSVALGWIISEEDFFRNSLFNSLKLRVGWGISGNQTSRYNSLSRMTTGPVYVFGDGGSTLFGQQISTLGNPDLKWERVIGINGGIDFSLVDSRISGSIDFYNNVSHDLLFDATLPSVTGFKTISTNLGKLRNTGMEFSVNSKNFVGAEFRWSTTLSFSLNRNKILTLLGTDIDGDGKEDDLVASNLFIGHSIGTVYSYVLDGIYQVGDSDIPNGYAPGNYRIVDINNDGRINSDDRKILGRTEPSFRFSIFNKLDYKNFGLSILINSIQGSKNSYLANNILHSVRDDNHIRRNDFNKSDYWSPINPKGIDPRSMVEPAIAPDRFFKRSFVRLQDLSLSYSFNNSLFQGTPLDGLSVFVSGRNLITLTKWRGWDPETGQGMLMEEGRPVLRSYTLGLNISL